MFTTELITNIIKHIRTQAQPTAIYIFGSYAYGTPHEDSDLDLMIVKPIVINRYKELAPIKAALGSADYSIDILLRSEAQFEEQVKQGWSMFQDIVTKGIRFGRIPEPDEQTVIAAIAARAGSL